MLQTLFSTPLVSIQLTPMRIPETVPNQESTWFAPGIATESITQKSLLVHPGESSEIVVQVKNLAQRNLRLTLKVEGDFPSEWCQVVTEDNKIAPGAQMDAVLYFSIPANYFEDQQAINPENKDRLVLNFRSRVYVYIDPGTEKEQIEEEEFNLYIRPHSRYINFLPIIYREVDFIGRFIKIFEETVEPLIESFNVMWANLDSLTAPQALLPFLAHWVAWPLDPVWDIAQQRRLIRRAIELYRWRGTRKGLRLYLHLYTGLPLDEHIAQESNKHISITEPFSRGFILDSAKLGEDAVLGGGQPYHFNIRLRSDNYKNIDEILVRQIIEQEKPAFSTYNLFVEKF
ncbi:phage tail protein [Nostoc sp. FACHB-152]|uniref:phage tail protein n=1 Tax=unclassified Nostoc TaxID=2593658 RepID=UPI00168503D3|nr:MULTISPECIES: phage tail protein [unclassified Nostoc]MBD2449735.1 phage tail protein [Nostoc sp. FACHB-152]MBD2469888.1 phage tail protein [Nostoc sp. FACHB-145]